MVKVVGVNTSSATCTQQQTRKVRRGGTGAHIIMCECEISDSGSVRDANRLTLMRTTCAALSDLPHPTI